MFVWNVEDPGSEGYFHAGLSIAGALSLPASTHGEEVGPGLEALRKRFWRSCVRRGPGEIEKSANMIGNGSDKILDGLGVMRTGRRSTGETGHPERCHVIS